jgi:opacity protein-like surface antigen
MKRIYIFLLGTAAVLCFSGTLLSQSNISIQVMGGITFPTGNFKEEVPLVDTVRTIWPYQMSTAFTIGARGRIALQKSRKLNATFGVSYSSFSNNEQVVNIYASSGSGPTWNDRSGVGGVSTVTFHPKINIITIAAGIEYDLKPAEQWDPFGFFDVTGNFFSGNFSFDGVSTGIYTPTDLKSATRIGLQLGGGVEYRINDDFGLLGGLRYHFTNVFGKTTSEIGAHTNVLELGDKAGSYNGIATPTKNISYLNIFIGASLYLRTHQTGKK